MDLDPKQLIFDVRYRFEYWDNKPARNGKWNHSGQHAENQAWSVNKTNLAWAFIEAKNILSGETRKVVECPGQDFRFYQWKAIRSVSLKMPTIKTPTMNIGLVMWTRTKKIAVYRFGKIDVEELNEDDMKFHFASYGR